MVIAIPIAVLLELWECYANLQPRNLNLNIGTTDIPSTVTLKLKDHTACIIIVDNLGAATSSILTKHKFMFKVCKYCSD